MKIDDMGELLERWGSKTLGQMYREATAQETGVAYDALRASTGPRFAIVVCIVTHDLEGRFIRGFEVSPDTDSGDWETMSIFGLIRQAKGLERVLVLAQKDAQAIPGHIRCLDRG